MSDPTNSTSASFDFSADEPGATFECAIDGGAWGVCTSPKAYAGLADGGHTFEVRATDPAGNTDGNPAAFNWTIDTVAPSSTATFPANAGSYTTAEWSAGCPAAGLCGTYSDTGVGVVEVEVSIRRGTANYWDGSGFTSGAEVWNHATFAAGDWDYAFDSSDFPADGDYTVRLRARDDAGNTESASSRTFTFDATAPGSTVSFPASAGTYDAAGLGRGLHRRRPLRHLRGRHLRRRRGRGLHPPGLRRLLERHRVRERHRGVERRRPRRRRLGLRLRRLPGGRQLHGSRPRDRRRRQRRDGLVAHLHL